ncbi:MAG: hypothetical protein HKN63_03765 [Rhodobacteraceae bacterium]|nr:hypothetical protein [Paracoccaceae bacterium]
MGNETHIKIREACRAVYAAILSGQGWDAALGRYDALRSALAPREVARLDPGIRADARWASPRSNARCALLRFGRAPARSARLEKALKAQPGVARLLIHDPDGRVREAAARAMPDPCNDAAALAALVLRCNDWAGDVRTAALQRIRKIAARPSVPALPELMPLLLDQVARWQRGGAEALRLLEARADWPGTLLAMFRHETSGPLARRLRAQLSDADASATLEPYLPDLALSARSSFVRSVAAEIVSTGEARWREGYEWEWIDKVYGLRRRRTIWGCRKIRMPADVVGQVLERAAQDKSSGVRKRAADRLIAEGPGAANAALIETLRTDTARAVRARMEYYDRKWLGENSQSEAS